MIFESYENIREKSGGIQVIILGIDPGYAITGYGLLNYIGNKFIIIDYGVITTEAGSALSERLLIISNRLEELITYHKPDAVSVEELFFSKNIKTALSAAHGRGIALLSAAKHGIGIYEYTPLQVKQAVVGYGRAEKSQMQQMVKAILNLPEIPKPDDAADALAVAICHAHSYRMNAYEGK
jgi:crossover junction endodeoxyribonuclease RuvC